jgi:hypothetical protein
MLDRCSCAELQEQNNLFFKGKQRCMTAETKTTGFNSAQQPLTRESCKACRSFLSFASVLACALARRLSASTSALPAAILRFRRVVSSRRRAFAGSCKHNNSTTAVSNRLSAATWYETTVPSDTNAEAAGSQPLTRDS